jgi:hypothetical protein
MKLDTKGVHGRRTLIITSSNLSLLAEIQTTVARLSSPRGARHVSALRLAARISKQFQGGTQGTRFVLDVRTRPDGVRDFRR